jgi:hypothetical protein
MSEIITKKYKSKKDYQFLIHSSQKKVSSKRIRKLWRLTDRNGPNLKMCMIKVRTYLGH